MHCRSACLLRAAAGLGLIALLLIPAAAAAPGGTVRLRGAAYENLETVARRFGLAVRWTPAAKEARLWSRWTQIDLEPGGREIRLNGLRVFLGDPVLPYGRDLWVSRRDVDKLLAPVLAPRPAHSAPPLRTIAVDAGHGGNDHGTTNRALRLDEKEVTLDVARRVAQLLEAAKYRVVLTRHDDRYVGLDRRTDIANGAGADLFVSIHFNAAGPAAVSGVQTYTMTPRYQTSTQPEHDRDLIAQAFPGNRDDYWNSVLGYQMHRELVTRLKTADRGWNHRRLAVLRGIRCPGVLVEPGYLSNPAEAARLRTPAYRQRVAEAVVAGIQAYARVLRRADGR